MTVFVSFRVFVNVISGLLQKSDTGMKRENNDREKRQEQREREREREKRRNEHIYVFVHIYTIRKEGKNPCTCMEMSIRKFRVDVKNIPTWNVGHV
jgi:hypothetical protein